MLFPDAGLHRGPDVERSDLQPGVLAAARDERHRVVAGGQGRFDRLHRARDHALGTELALLRVLDRRLDLLDGLADAGQFELCVVERLGDRLGERRREALAGER